MSRVARRCRAVPMIAVVVVVTAAGCTPLRPSDPQPGADAVRRLTYPPLRFEAPEPARFQLSNGITVFFLADATLPVLDVFVDLKGGYTYFDRDHFAAGTALLSLMRHGGTTTLTPDSLDDLLEFHALGMQTYSDGGRMLLGIRGLRRHVDLALDLWSDVLLRPGFDPPATERWRAREVDAVRHLGDFPGSLAVLEFNRLFFGGHSSGWLLTEDDLAPERMDRDRLLSIHRQTVCPENAVIGASGDITREEIEAALERVLAEWAPCGTTLEPPAPPVLDAEPGVYIIPKSIPQSTIVVGQPGGVRLGEAEEYFASRVANWLIGGGGPTSRLEARLRTDEGLAYSASSVWGVARDHERIFGAITHTRAERTIDATEMIVGLLNEARTDPPDASEIERARESITSGYVFGFGSSAQIVARQVSYMADDLPPDWMSRYLAGIRRVDARQVANVLRRTLHPDRYTILIVGDTTRFDPARLGPHTILPSR